MRSLLRLAVGLAIMVLGTYAVVSRPDPGLWTGSRSPLSPEISVPAGEGVLPLSRNPAGPLFVRLEEDQLAVYSLRGGQLVPREQLPCPRLTLARRTRLERGVIFADRTALLADLAPEYTQ